MAVPMELLAIKRGQKRTGLLIGEQQAKLVKIAAQKPEQKRADIGTWIQKSSKSMTKSAQTFGIAVDQKPAAVNGRLLPAPVIEYSQPSHYYAGTTGAWNMKDVRPHCLLCLIPVLLACITRAFCGVLRASLHSLDYSLSACLPESLAIE